MTRRLLHRLSARWLPVFLLGLSAVHAAAQGDPPGRVGRINHAEGTVTFSTTGDDEWTDANANRPLTRGDRLYTENKSRAEIQVGSSSVRMDGQTKLEIMVLDDQATQLSVTQGSLYVRVRSLPEGENFEIDTPQLAYRAAYPGDYRIDVDPIRGSTRVTIHSGTGAVYGETGQSMSLGGGQQITFKLRNLTQMAVQESPPQDNFDRWALERNRRDDQSVAARYIPREVVGYQQLDSTGTWSQDATYGPVWFPQGVAANWAPYRQGRWEWVAPWGWTWIDDAAWGFAPFHYGRWAMVGSKWGWVPGRIGLRPVYAPALVAFLGGSTGGVNWSTTIGGGKPGVAWFPLAPGEAWQPGYRASPVYLSNLNRNLAPVAGQYAHQKRAEALTAVSVEDFNKGKLAKSSWMRVAGNLLGTAQVVAPPPMPEHVTRPRTAVAQAAAGQAPGIRNVAAAQQQDADTQRLQQQVAQAQRQKLAAEQAQRAAEQAKAEQARAAEQARTEQAKAEQARAVEQAKAQQQAQLQRATEQAKAEQAKAEQAKAQQAKVEQVKVEQAKAEQARTAELARAQQQRAAEVAKAEQAKAAGQNKIAQLLAAEQAKAAQAKAAEQSRRVEQARTEEARLAQQTRRAEQSRVAEEARAAQQGRLAQQARAREEQRLAQQERQADQARTDARERRLAQQQARTLAKANASASAAAAKTARAAPAARVAEARQETRRELLATKRAEQKRELLARREQAQRDIVAKRDAQLHARHEAVARREQAQRDEQARRAEASRREAVARREEEIRRVAHVEQARRSAEKDALALKEQRTKREEQQRREDEARQQAQRDAWQKQQQALSEQWRRDQQTWEQQQRERSRGQRPDLRKEPASPPVEVWQRGNPLISPGRTS